MNQVMINICQNTQFHGPAPHRFNTVFELLQTFKLSGSTRLAKCHIFYTSMIAGENNLLQKQLPFLTHDLHFPELLPQKERGTKRRRKIIYNQSNKFT